MDQASSASPQPHGGDAPRRIGIDARVLSRTRVGHGHVLQCLLDGLRNVDTRNTYYLYSDHDFDFPQGDGRWHKRVHCKFGFLPGTVWLWTDLQRMVAEDQLDLFWGPGHILPPGIPPQVVRVVTLHDVVWKKYPDTMGRFNRLTHWLLIDRSIREANAVITVSKSTASETHRLLGVPESKIHVVYNGVNPAYQPQPHAAAARDFASKYNVSREYILALGTIEPRKNLITLIEAVKILRERFGFRHQLVIAGIRGWRSSEVYESAEKAGLTQGDVAFPGYLEEGDLPKAYSGAAAFVMPSFYEGFGLPVLEAMACGVPVVTSDASALVEIGGDAAISVPARRADLLAEAIHRVLHEEALRNRMIERGYAQARQFCWEASARRLVGLFEQLCQHAVGGPSAP